MHMNIYVRKLFYMYMYIYICIYIFKYRYICSSISISSVLFSTWRVSTRQKVGDRLWQGKPIYIYIYIYICLYTYICIYTYCSWWRVHVCACPKKSGVFLNQFLVISSQCVCVWMCMRVCLCVCMCARACVRVWTSLPLLAIWFMYVCRHGCAHECMYLSMRVHVRHSHSSPWESGLISRAMHDGCFPTMPLLRGMICVFSCARAHRVCVRLCTWESVCTSGLVCFLGMREWWIWLWDWFLLSCRPSSSRHMQKQTLANRKNTIVRQTQVPMKNGPYVLQTTRKKRHETRQLKRVSCGAHFED